MKVYLFNIESVDDTGIHIVDSVVFSTLEKAQAHLNKVKNEFLTTIDIDYNYYEIDERDDFFEYFAKDFYDTDHYTLWITEKVVE